MQENNISFFISAGDVSGDMHAANLVKAIKEINSSIKIFCIGGNRLKKECDFFLEDIVNLNAFGFFPLKQILFLKKLLKKIELNLKENKINKVILTDYYGFNIHIAKVAKQLNIPVYYFVSPQIWASRSGRIKNIAKYVKKVFPIFPFEKDIYLKASVDAVFEGNPLIDVVPDVDKEKKLDEPLNIGLFVGSRQSVIKRHLPIILETVKILKSKINARFKLFIAGGMDVWRYRGIKTANDKENRGMDVWKNRGIEVVDGNDWEKRKNIDIAINPSGTVSLENALIGIPMVVMYKLAWANYLLARLIVKVKYITIVNILADKPIVPEYIQHKATPQNLAEAVLKYLNTDIYNKKRQELLQFKNMLGTKGVCERIAKNILEDN